MKAKGKVYLVGAGPGDAGLLTLRGAELLAHAEVVICDPLVNPALLQLASAQAEIIGPDQQHPEHNGGQARLRQLLLAKAREGKKVVRLQGGDPFVFGHGSEEAEDLAAARIPFEVVPGVSSAVAGPAYAGIPLTHRQYCSSFTVVTESGKIGAPDILDYEAIAKIPGTKVVLTGPDQIRPLVEALMARGLAAETPVGMVRGGTTSQQQSLQGTLGTIAQLAEEHHFTTPAVTVIGEVVRLRNKLNWFEQRPLFGQRIVVTRAREQARALVKPLQDLGADVLEIPTIRIAPPDDKQPLTDAFLSLGEYDWLVFTSPNGVTTFFDYFLKGFQDLRAIGNVRIAAVGPGTAARIADFHLRVDVMPEEHLGRNIANAINRFESVENLKFLLLRAEAANPDLPKELMELGAIVDDVPCYKTVAETEDRTGASTRLLQGQVDWITFTSGSTVESFHARFDLPKLLSQFPHIKVASIGPETSKALVTLGLQPTVEARQHNIEGLIHTLESHCKKEAGQKL